MTDLENAYALRGAEDCARLYAEWAKSYDSGFAKEMDYRLPAHVAAAFLAHGGTGPILDVGAGTGLLAEHLRALGCSAEIDGLDLSSAMLERAAEKGLYANLIVADVTTKFVAPRAYGGFVSSGTFTHGHVGPEALSVLESIAHPGALFAVSINAGVFVSEGFDVALDGRKDVRLIEVDIYGPESHDPAHRSDRAIIALWNSAG